MRTYVHRHHHQYLVCCLLLLITTTTTLVGVYASTIFNSNKAKDASNLKDMKFVSRFMMPYGPNLYGKPPLQTSSDQPYAGYGYGMVSCFSCRVSLCL